MHSLQLAALACLLLILTLTPPNHATIQPPQPQQPTHQPSTRTHSTHQPYLATLLAGVSSALRDLTAGHSDSATSYVTVAKRGVRLVLSGLAGPLQLLDWSQWSTTEAVGGSEGGVGEGWLGGEDEAGLYGEPSQSFRAMVNAHKQPAQPRIPHRSHNAHRSSLPYSPSDFPLPLATLNDSATSNPTPMIDPNSPLPISPTIVDSSSLIQAHTTLTTPTTTTTDSIDAPYDTCYNNGIAVRFVRLVNGTRQTTTLCYCPADTATYTCASRRPYRCTAQLATDATDACTAVRNTSNPTLHTSQASSLPAVHLADSASPYYTYEPILSGPPAPCLVLSEGRPLAMSFTCLFVDGPDGAAVVWSEGFDAARLADRLSRGYVLNESLPVLRYVVKNVDANGNVTFAMSGSGSGGGGLGLSVSVRLHNTAHPSQWQQTVLQLTPAQLQLVPATASTTPLTLLPNTTSLDPNLKRGGRILLTLRWHTIASGAIIAGSGLPWQLVVEDGQWTLPANAAGGLWAWLAGWRLVGVVCAVVAVAALWGWRLYQRRETSRMQALFAEQRGKQESWFIAGH